MGKRIFSAGWKAAGPRNWQGEAVCGTLPEVAVAEGRARVSSDSPGVGPDGGWGWGGGEARNARGGEGGGRVRKEGLGDGKRSLCLWLGRTAKQD